MHNILFLIESVFNAMNVFLFFFQHVMSRLAVFFGLCVLVFIKTLSEGKSLPFRSSLSYDRLVWNVLRYSVIREHFSCTRVALVNWKSTSFRTLLHCYCSVVTFLKTLDLMYIVVECVRWKWRTMMLPFVVITVTTGSMLHVTRACR